MEAPVVSASTPTPHRVPPSILDFDVRGGLRVGPGGQGMLGVVEHAGPFPPPR